MDEVKKSYFPPGWDEERVQRVIAHYEGQTDEEAAAEDEAVFENEVKKATEPKIALDEASELSS